MTVSLINKRTVIIIELCVYFLQSLRKLISGICLSRLYNDKRRACCYSYKLTYEYSKIIVRISLEAYEFTGKDPMICHVGESSLFNGHTFLSSTHARKAACINHIRCIRIIFRYISKYMYY